MKSIMTSTKTTTALRWALIVAIIIILNLFFNYAISLVYDAPDRDMYFSVNTEDECAEIGGDWNEFEEKTLSSAGERAGYCDANSAYNEAREPYERNVFIALVILGVISLGIGVLISGTSVVATGLSFGGVLSLIIGSLRYWSSADDIIRLLILAIALALLIWLGITKFKD